MRFNDYVRVHPEDFLHFRMWRYDAQDLPRPDYNVAPITDEQVESSLFIMLGRWTGDTEVDIQEILQNFDRLLPLYAYVESEQSPVLPDAPPPFIAGCPAFVLTATTSITARTIDVALRHKALQRILFDCLCAESGSDNVSIEHKLELGVSVDAAVQTTAGLTFYELKIAPSVQACMRASMGQLLEYAYWPSAARACELIVVGEYSADDDAIAFLHLLRERFSLPLWYRKISLGDHTLGART